MKKVVIHRPGGHDRLKIEEHPLPEPGPGEVRVAVQAIGTGYADCLIRMGLYKSSKDQVGWPVTPGFEVAGHVDALGQGAETEGVEDLQDGGRDLQVGDLQVGDRVLAIPRFGGYATHVVVPRLQVFRLPEGLTLEQGAALPTAFLTAYYAWFLLVHPRGEETVLVHSAAGGVGGALVQLGKLAGCRVVGVVGASHKVETARDFGADAVIDKSRQDLWEEARRHAPDRYDVIFDANGVETLMDSLRHVGSPGKLVIYGFHSMLEKGRDRPSWWKLLRSWWKTPRFDPLRLTNRNRSVLAFNLSYQFDRLDVLQEVMADLLGWLEEGKIQPPPIQTLPFEQVAEAHRALESGQTVGKVVLTVGG